jgi:hypothetical protein
VTAADMGVSVLDATGVPALDAAQRAWQQPIRLSTSGWLPNCASSLSVKTRSSLHIRPLLWRSATRVHRVSVSAQLPLSYEYVMVCAVERTSVRISVGISVRALCACCKCLLLLLGGLSRPLLCHWTYTDYLIYTWHGSEQQRK